MTIPFDPTSGLPLANSKPKTPATVKITIGGGPGEPKQSVLGGYGGGTGVLDAPTPVTAPKITPPTTSYTNTIPTESGGGTTAPVSSVPSSGDLQKLIESDPLYMQTQQDIAAQRAGDQAALTAARQRDLIQYGSIPDLSAAGSSLGLVGNVGDDITDTVKQLAQQNTSAGLSTTAQLQQAYNDAVKSTQDDLTARGLLSSGETGYQLGRDNQNYTSSTNSALQQLLDALAGLQSSYLTNENSRQSALEQAAAAAAGRIPVTTAPAPDPGLVGSLNPGGQPITITPGVNDQVPQASLPDFTNPDITGNLTPTQLQQYVSQMNPLTGLFPSETALPVAVSGPQNKTGLSANKKQGVFSLH